jgi:hypothetical protein
MSLDKLINSVGFWGASPPDPPGSASPRIGLPKLSSAKQNKRFLLLFLDKEECH